MSRTLCHRPTWNEGVGYDKLVCATKDNHFKKTPIRVTKTSKVRITFLPNNAKIQQLMSSSIASLVAMGAIASGSIHAESPPPDQV